MKLTTKVILGIGTIAVTGVAAATIATGKMSKELSHMSNRSKVKKFVGDMFGKNEQMFSIIDSLTDDEISVLAKILAKVENKKEKSSNYGKKMKEDTDNMMNRFFKFIEEMMPN
ncbi:hypothetical protein QQG09_02895 [Melissococcus plutonius]|uniref:Uncharacterized protein n=1 Tax=Melissococcus plutonius TaxID=33970 RepID=A0A2Z5Y2S4_9ENTE|nr:hypothetical protein [Melissococcus plutonius]BAL62214.1 hypothetical protein MPD5_0984 [Melissococcus plutonius DAT561]MCV2497985.1 hypothetical protein [Melissococcus plutonius]MCV2500789.1 hypothetical protein [Melissococcus plutonius]MCV2505325.1 hypothetical protein [Melissococcus plutonius]MCV2506600.1 hypothetical protein [Melissococcus plutonius]